MANSNTGAKADVVTAGMKKLVADAVAQFLKDYNATNDGIPALRTKLANLVKNDPDHAGDLTGFYFEQTASLQALLMPVFAYALERMLLETALANDKATFEKIMYCVGPVVGTMPTSAFANAVQQLIYVDTWRYSADRTGMTLRQLYLNVGKLTGPAPAIPPATA